MRKFYIFALVATMFAACATDGVNEPSAVIEDLAPETLTVSFEGEESRIQLQEGKTVWNEGDLVSVFYRSNANQKWQYQGETGERTGNLKRVEMGTATETMNRVVVVYPYAENYYINPETCNVEASLPAQQTYIADSYGVGGNIMVSSGEYNQVVLKSVCGWLKLELTGNGESIKAITLKGNYDEQVAGQLYINSADATAVLASEMGGAEDNGSAGGNLVFEDTILKEVTLNCGEGVELSAEPTAFYIALPPQTFNKGISLEITAADGSKMTKSTDKEVVIERNHILPMEAFEVEFEKGESIIVPPNNEIWYTSVDGAIVTPGQTDVFGANIVSNTYENGKGIIKFDGDITMIGRCAFYECSSLTSIAIPNSATYIRGLAFRYCSNLISVIIGEGVTFIDTCAFGDCNSLIKVYCKSTTVPALAYSNAFHINAMGRKFYVPVNLITEYIWSDYWIEFANDIVPYDFDNGREVKILPNNEIWYMATAKVEPYAIDVFGANIIANEWDSATGKGVITFDGDVIEIGMRAFLYCRDLISIIIPDSAISIGRESFYDCSALTNVIISNGVQSIGMYAFHTCDNLESAVVPDSVTTIADQAFAKCENLISVVIGRGIQSIGSQQFYQSRSLKNVYCKPTIPPSVNGSDLFFDNASGRKIYVPRNSVDVYKAASGWSSYASYIEGYDF